MHFAYIVVKRGDPSDESTGIIESTNMDKAIFKLLADGYIIMDIRTARLEDIKLENLKLYRRRFLTKENNESGKSRHIDFPWYYLLVAIILALMIWYFH